jgi:galactose-1-phosphate uridylyltransferase
MGDFNNAGNNVEFVDLEKTDYEKMQDKYFQRLDKIIVEREKTDRLRIVLRYSMFIVFGVFLIYLYFKTPIPNKTTNTISNATGYIISENEVSK